MFAIRRLEWQPATITFLSGCQELAAVPSHNLYLDLGMINIIPQGLNLNNKDIRPTHNVVCICNNALEMTSPTLITNVPPSTVTPFKTSSRKL